jgi:hypothetical protein
MKKSESSSASIAQTGQKAHWHGGVKTLDQAP